MLFTVLMRRSMMRVAEKLSIQYGADALITGESLAQVASQTLKAIVCTDAAQELPVLRPLIGMDKSEITEIARRIDTYEISIQPFEDCCTIFTPAASQDQAHAGRDPCGGGRDAGSGGVGGKGRRECGEDSY